MKIGVDTTFLVQVSVREHLGHTMALEEMDRRMAAAKETEQASPTLESMDYFWKWMKEHSLGRKRVLDTMLAATYSSHGVTVILSSNARGFNTFGCFQVIGSD